MKFFKLLWIVFFLIALFAKQYGSDPLFFELPIQIHESLEQNQVGELMEDGFIEPLSVELISDSKGPIYYQSTIRTTVCDDEVCEIMNIKLFWDLVGEYVGYDTVAQHPLTKFDHEPFTKNDYERLHELLKNEGSILKFKQKSELIDKEKVKASDVVDGTTGATSLEIKEEVVEGALYSSYTLWHLAHNGQIKNMLTANSRRVLDEHLIQYLLDSDRSGYTLFAFQNFQEKDYTKYKRYWLRSLKDDIPLTRKYIIKNIPTEMWRAHIIQEEVCLLFNFYDVNTKTYLLNKIEKTEDISSKSLEYISFYLTEMNRNQISQFLDILSKSEKLTVLTRDNISRAANNKEFNFSYLINERHWVN